MHGCTTSCHPRMDGLELETKELKRELNELKEELRKKNDAMLEERRAFDG